MTCKICRRWMSEFLDGSLDVWIKEGFEEHLKACPACRSQLHSMQTLQKTLADLQPIRPSSHFHFALRARLIEELARRKRLRSGFRSWGSYRRPILAMASLFLLIVSSIRLSFHKPAEEIVHSERIVTHYVLERISPSDRSASISLDSDSNVPFTAPDTVFVPAQTVSGRIRTVSF
ncbi:MAG: zf-HC2 domain-containing protein [Candidatus Latescibacteria bacterium]|nr:zf-HC2 domain-containing protein [Candidatus Latescibacterota bacterium]